MRKILLFLITYFFVTIASASQNVAILVYHDLDPVKKGSMTISVERFKTQMLWLKENGYTFIPLQQLVLYLQGKIAALPARSVVITADDGRVSVYQYMLPIAREYHIPITLFIYPMVISHASYALTWEQLKTLQQTGLFTVEDHTYWHPNFRQERKRMSSEKYARLVHTQLVTSKEILQKKLGTPVTLLAWPFGIYDSYLEAQAKKAGYTMAFTIAAQKANRTFRPMAEPRYMIVDSQNMHMFAAIVGGGKR